MSLSPWVASMTKTIAAVSTFAGITAEDVVFDLGCGDARVLIAINDETSAHGVGIDFDAAWVQRAQRRVAQCGKAEVIKILHSCFLEADLSSCTVAYLFLTDHAIRPLQPHLLTTLKPGTRILCCMAPLHHGSIEPEKTMQIPDLGPMGMLYLYRVPPRKGEEEANDKRRCHWRGDFRSLPLHFWERLWKPFRSSVGSSTDILQPGGSEPHLTNGTGSTQGETTWESVKATGGYSNTDGIQVEHTAVSGNSTSRHTSSSNGSPCF